MDRGPFLRPFKKGLSELSPGSLSGAGNFSIWGAGQWFKMCQGFFPVDSALPPGASGIPPFLLLTFGEDQIPPIQKRKANEKGEPFLPENRLISHVGGDYGRVDSP